MPEPPPAPGLPAPPGPHLEAARSRSSLTPHCAGAHQDLVSPHACHHPPTGTAAGFSAPLGELVLGTVGRDSFQTRLRGP